jgi:hypothetical protein
LASGEQVSLNFVTNHCKAVAADKSQVREEDSHEDGAPDELVKCHLHGNMLGISPLNLSVQPVVEVMAGGAMVEETKG